MGLRTIHRRRKGLQYFLSVTPTGSREDLSNKGEVLVHGVRCPVVGRICMDQCMVNVSGLQDVKVGDEAVIIGRQGEEEISVYANALENSGTIMLQLVQ